jgi:hypothetical protein
VCFFVRRDLRGRGWRCNSAAAVSMRRKKCRRDPVEPGQSYQFMGSPAIFKAAGFREVARAENDRSIVRRILRQANT